MQSWMEYKRRLNVLRRLAVINFMPSSVIVLKMATSFCVPISIMAVCLAIFLGPKEGCAKSLAKEVCKDRNCRAGIGNNEDGVCYCCTDCSLFNRVIGNHSCPDSPEKCGPCIPGYEFIPNINSRCRMALLSNPVDVGENDGSGLNVGKPQTSLSENGGTHALNWSAILSVAAVAGIVGIAGFGAVVLVVRRKKTTASHKAANRYSVSSMSSSNHASAEAIQLLTSNESRERVGNCTANFSSPQTENQTQLLRQFRTPVEDFERAPNFEMPNEIKETQFVVRQASESVQTAVPICANEAMQNPAQTFAQQSLNEPVENDESMDHLPSAPPDSDDTLASGCTACSLSYSQQDSGFQTQVDSDESMASTYSNATTAVIGGESPQGSPISPAGRDDGVDSDNNSSSFSRDTSPNTQLPEGMSVNLEVYARVNIQN